MAGYTADDIVAVRLNDTVTITNFEVKTTSENTAMVDYYVDTSMGLTEITNIKLLGANNLVLTDAIVFVILTGDSTLIKHNITYTEGGGR